MNNLHVITLASDSSLSIKYLLALINSKLFDFYHYLLNPEKGEALAEVKKENLEKLPVKVISAKAQRPLIELVDRILSNKGSDTKSLEEQLDKLVFELYNINDDELKIIVAAV